MNFPNKNRGFTLIELSIVLVIIGLIVGGVLVGQDLIKTAELRSTLKQVEDIKTAFNTFRIKYNCMPGDCANATSFFSDAVNGDGNERISGGGTGLYESYNVWHQLAEAGMIKQQFSPISADPTPPYGNFGYNSPIGKNVFFVVYSSTYTKGFSTNYITLSVGPLPMDNFGALGLLLQYYTLGSYVGVHPLQAQYLDQKIDDGLPLTGTVLSPIQELSTDDKTSCPKTDGSNLYNIQSLYYNCMPFFQLQ